MTTERDGWNGPITFCCDNCGEVEETHCSDWSSAQAKVKAHGWQARWQDGEWYHYCKDCKHQ